jgi:hypothetical protein
MYSGDQARLESRLEVAYHAVWRAQTTAASMDRLELADDLQAVLELLQGHATAQLRRDPTRGTGVTRSTGGRIRRVV